MRYHETFGPCRVPHRDAIVSLTGNYSNSRDSSCSAKAPASESSPLVYVTVHQRVAKSKMSKTGFDGICVLSCRPRYGIRVSDIRLTSQSIFDICKDWTGQDWRGGQRHWKVDVDVNGSQSIPVHFNAALVCAV